MSRSVSGLFLGVFVRSGFYQNSVTVYLLSTMYLRIQIQF